MQTKFPLGKVTVQEEAALALTLAGQDADFFLEKHAAGDWGEGDAAPNEAALREGQMLLSRCRTLWRHEVFVTTFSGRAETHLFCPPNSVVRYVPSPDLAAWRQKG
jgi:hypothetical protein